MVYTLSGGNVMRVTYVGKAGSNKPPTISNFKVSKVSGPIPYVGTFKVTATDPEQDSLSYTW